MNMYSCTTTTTIETPDNPILTQLSSNSSTRHPAENNSSTTRPPQNTVLTQPSTKNSHLDNITEVSDVMCSYVSITHLCSLVEVS